MEASIYFHGSFYLLPWKLLSTFMEASTNFHEVASKKYNSMVDDDEQTLCQYIHNVRWFSSCGYGSHYWDSFRLPETTYSYQVKKNITSSHWLHRSWLPFPSSKSWSPVLGAETCQCIYLSSVATTIGDRNGAPPATLSSSVYSGPPRCTKQSPHGIEI